MCTSLPKTTNLTWILVILDILFLTPYHPHVDEKLNSIGSVTIYVKNYGLHYYWQYVSHLSIPIPRVTLY